MRSKFASIDSAVTNLRAFGGRKGPLLATCLAALLTVIPAPAVAHDGTGLVGGFSAGFIHPLMGFDHMLAMVAVGIWGAFLGRPMVVALPVAFPAVMAFGGGIGMLGLPFPPVELGIAISVAVLGAVILFALRLSLVAAGSLVGFFALFHGYAHGTELPSAADPVGYSAGFVLCTGLLHLAGISLGTLRSLPMGAVALRAAGGVIALLGVSFTVWALPA